MDSKSYVTPRPHESLSARCPECYRPLANCQNIGVVSIIGECHYCLLCRFVETQSGQRKNASATDNDTLPAHHNPSKSQRASTKTPIVDWSGLTIAPSGRQQCRPSGEGTISKWLITGDGVEQQHFLYLDLRAFPVTTAPFLTQVKLVTALYVTGNGFLQPTTFGDSPNKLAVNVCRLRKAIDAACGPGTGQDEIIEKKGSQYRLTANLCEIEVAESFFELPKSIIPEDLMQLMREISGLREDSSKSQVS